MLLVCQLPFLQSAFNAEECLLLSSVFVTASFMTSSVLCSAAQPKEILPKAEKQEARQLTDVERKRIREREEGTFRELRLFLRDVINKLGRDRKFAMFAKPVDVTEVTTPVSFSFVGLHVCSG